jgi:hypothetical protein
MRKIQEYFNSTKPFFPRSGVAEFAVRQLLRILSSHTSANIMHVQSAPATMLSFVDGEEIPAKCLFEARGVVIISLALK